MKVATAKEMQSIDRKSIEEYGIPGLILMENAGIKVVEEIKKRYGDIKGRRITIISGKGNNGGDGFVVGRHLFNAGVGVRIFLLSEIDSVKGDARVNLDAYMKIGGELFDSSLFDKDRLMSAITHSCLLIDAIFGTGLSSSITGFIGEIVSLINLTKRPVVSIDIPSGISSDTGEVLGIAVEADMTVTFALPKQGHFLYPGTNYCGDLRIADISIPEKAVDNEGIKTNLITEENIRGLSIKRKRDTHKGSYGHALIIAGSGGKTGAALMTGISALRAGAGLVTVALPESISDMISIKHIELMTLPLPETDDKTISREAIENILAFASDKEVIAIGPGLSMNRDTSELVRDVVSEIETPIVVDADGINALVGHLDILKKKRSPVIMTPHPGEMARILEMNTKMVQKDRIGTARSFAREYKVYLVLKGAYTIIADPEGNIYINPTGNPGMATAGSGDILTGVIAGFIAQWQSDDIIGAVNTAVYLHGIAGDMAAAQKGETGMIAHDIIENIPEAIKGNIND